MSVQHLHMCGGIMQTTIRLSRWGGKFSNWGRGAAPPHHQEGTIDGVPLSMPGPPPLIGSPSAPFAPGKGSFALACLTQPSRPPPTAFPMWCRLCSAKLRSAGQLGEGWLRLVWQEHSGVKLSGQDAPVDPGDKGPPQVPIEFLDLVALGLSAKDFPWLQ